jgi:hypothetical protein
MTPPDLMGIALMIQLQRLKRAKTTLVMPMYAMPSREEAELVLEYRKLEKRVNQPVPET